MPLLFGAHVIDNGGLHMAARRAARAGMHALQIFTAKPQFYNDKSSINAERAQRFREALGASAIQPENVLVHAGYVLNVATLEEEKWVRSAAALTRELDRSTRIGAGGVCFHPGSAGTGDKGKSVENVTRAMTLALEGVQGKTRLLIENTAGGGNTMGRTATEIAAMLSGLPDRLRARAGYGLDTCHLFASGFEITRSRDHLVAILEAFHGETGEAPSFFHLNDSVGDFGSNRDKHALIGEGKIGLEPFAWLLGHPCARGIPLILETPQENPGVGDDDDSPDPWDVKSIQLLRNLGQRETGAFS